MLTPPPPVPDAERPRERLLRHGAAVLTDAELLALVLRTGTAGRPVIALAHDILTHFGGLRGLFGAGGDTLGRVHGLGSAKICQLLSVLELARRAMRGRTGGRLRAGPTRAGETVLRGAAGAPTTSSTASPSTWTTACA